MWIADVVTTLKQCKTQPRAHLRGVQYATYAPSLSRDKISSKIIERTNFGTLRALEGHPTHRPHGRDAWDAPS